MVFPNLSLGSYALAGAVGIGLGVSYSISRTKESSPQISKTTAEKKRKRRSVYAFGYGQFGQLMLGNESDSFAPKRINFDPDVHAIVAASKTSALLTADGRVFTAGFGKDVRLGVPSANDSTNPIHVDLPSVQTQVALGEFGGACIDERGVLRTWGKNWGLDSGANTVPTPLADNVVSVAFGRQHVVFCNDKGEVYAYGMARDGALGLGDDLHANMSTPANLPGLSGITQVSCGRDFSFALSQDGEVFSFGRDRWGQLGLGRREEVVNRPTRVPFDSPVRQVECGESFTAVLTREGGLFLCGNGSEGQLGVGSLRTDSASFQRVSGLPEAVRQVSCGGGHVACVTESGRLFLWGRGRNGQLGRADVIESVASPRLAPVECTFFQHKRVLSVTCGGDHTLVLVEENED